MTASSLDILREGRFLTVAGSETFLLFQQQFPLREFCAFELFDDEAAVAEFEARFLHPVFETAVEHDQRLLLDALVWRAHPDFIAQLGYPADDLQRFNRTAVGRMRRSIDGWCEKNGKDAERFLVVADIGPRGDGYRVPEAEVSAESAADYHSAQLAALAETEVDAVFALTMTTPNESIGIVRAAAQVGLPVVVSPTVETDGTLPDGSSLGEFIEGVDAATGGGPVFYMVNCAHPTHLGPTLDAARHAGASWLSRLQGFRANASMMSHEELDDSAELDRGEPETLGRELAKLQREHGLRVLGGCCGTDSEHIAAIARAIG